MQPFSAEDEQIARKWVALAYTPRRMNYILGFTIY